MNQTVVPVMLNDGATLPKKAHRNDAGYDLTLPKARAIGPGERIVINTGVHVAIPQGHVGMVCARSGLAAQGITIPNAPGIIDPGYTGPIHVILTNIGENPYHLLDGERVAQLIIMPTAPTTLRQVDSLHATERGANGLGSTGRTTSVNPLARAYAVYHLEKAKAKMGRIPTLDPVDLLYEKEAVNHLDTALMHLDSRHGHAHVTMVDDAIGHLQTIIQTLDAVKTRAIDADTVTSVYDSATYALTSLTEIEQEPMP